MNMPTHKELLAQLTEKLELVSDKMSGPVILDSSSLEKSLEKKAHDNRGYAVLGLVAAVLASRRARNEMIREEIREINKKTSLFNSISCLGDSHERLTYDFIVERAYVEGTDQEERRTILNGLIIEGIVTEYNIDEELYYKIDDDKPEVIDWRERIDRIRKLLP
ncbi:MAG: hypothetical protein WCV79_02220 [Candidatus Paceibacterota bacterium]|jgi:hypothetical protein